MHWLAAERHMVLQVNVKSVWLRVFVDEVDGHNDVENENSHSLRWEYQMKKQLFWTESRPTQCKPLITEATFTRNLDFSLLSYGMVFQDI